MKKLNFNIFLYMGFGMYLVLTIIDRVIYKIPNVIYISIALLAFILVIVGVIIKSKGEKHGKK